MRLSAALIMLVVSGFIALCVVALVSTLFFGAPSPRAYTGALHNAFFTIATLAALGAAFQAAREAYRTPDLVFHFPSRLVRRFSLSTLTSPIKRLMFLVGIVGSTVACADILIFMASSYGDFLSNFGDFFWEVLRENTRHKVYRAFFWLGLSLAVSGFVFAYFFEATLGRLLNAAKNLRSWVIAK